MEKIIKQVELSKKIIYLDEVEYAINRVAGNDSSDRFTVLVERVVDGSSASFFC